jgi:hypothetical protein
VLNKREPNLCETCFVSFSRFLVEEDLIYYETFFHNKCLINEKQTGARPASFLFHVSMKGGEIGGIFDLVGYLVPGGDL